MSKFEPVNDWEDVKDHFTREAWLEAEINTATGFCGCYSPEAAYRTLRNVLTILKVRRQKDDRDVSFGSWYPGFKAGLEVTIGDRSHHGAAVAYLYWLDHMDLTEHGGSVPGWLTSKGEVVLGWLNELVRISA